MPGERQDDRFAEYLDSLRGLLKINRQRRNQIEDELRDHVEERVGELTARGMESAAATALALSEFGDAATLAADFSQITRHSKRNQIMRLCTTTAAIALILFMGFSMLHPNGQTEGTAQLVRPPEPQQVETPPAPSTSPASLSVNQDERNEATRELLSETSVDLELIEMPVADCLDFLKEECDGLQWYASASLSSGTVTPPAYMQYGDESDYGGGSGMGMGMGMSMEDEYGSGMGMDIEDEYGGSGMGMGMEMDEGYGSPGMDMGMGMDEGYGGAPYAPPHAYMDTMVTIDLSDIPAEMALRLVLDQAGLGYYLDNGVVIVTDVATAAAKLDIRVYDISGLIAAVGSNSNVAFGFKPTQTQSDATAFGGFGSNREDHDLHQFTRSKEIASQIIELVLDVSPDTWEVDGGPGGVNVFQNALIVRQTEEVHLQLEEFLKVVESVVSNQQTPQQTYPYPTTIPSPAYTPPTSARSYTDPTPQHPPQTPPAMPPTPYRQMPYPAEQQPQRANPADPIYLPHPPSGTLPTPRTPTPPQPYVPQTTPNPSYQPTPGALTPTYQPNPSPPRTTNQMSSSYAPSPTDQPAPTQAIPQAVPHQHSADSLPPPSTPPLDSNLNIGNLSPSGRWNPLTWGTRQTESIEENMPLMPSTGTDEPSPIPSPTMLPLSDPSEGEPLPPVSQPEADSSTDEDADVEEDEETEKE